MNSSPIRTIRWGNALRLAFIFGCAFAAAAPSSCIPTSPTKTNTTTPQQGATITSQRWQFDGLTNAGAVATSASGLIQNGASTSPEEVCCWQANFNGCVVRTRFAVQFSGSSVRLLSFVIAPGTTCAGVSLAQATGTGTANGSFPNATQASGQSTTLFNTPLGQAGGTANWRAFRP